LCELGEFSEEKDGGCERGCSWGEEVVLMEFLLVVELDALCGGVLVVDGESHGEVFVGVSPRFVGCFVVEAGSEFFLDFVWWGWTTLDTGSVCIEPVVVDGVRRARPGGPGFGWGRLPRLLGASSDWFWFWFWFWFCFYFLFYICGLSAVTASLLGLFNISM